VIIILSLDAPKSILETEKILKTLSSEQIYKKTKKTKKKQKKTKKTTWLGFFKNPGFLQPYGQVADSLRNGHLRDQLRQVRTNIKFLRHLVRGRRERNAQSKTLLRKLEVSNGLRQERLPKFVDKVEKIRQEFLLSHIYHVFKISVFSVADPDP
jgi:hypothetical protein